MNIAMSIPSAESALMQELDHQILLLEAAIEKAHTGAIPLLGNFEATMNGLCSAVVKGSPALKEEAEQKLRKMLGQLEILEVIVREKRETLVQMDENGN